MRAYLGNLSPSRRQHARAGLIEEKKINGKKNNKLRKLHVLYANANNYDRVRRVLDDGGGCDFHPLRFSVPARNYFYSPIYRSVYVLYDTTRANRAAAHARLDYRLS